MDRSCVAVDYLTRDDLLYELAIRGKSGGAKSVAALQVMYEQFLQIPVESTAVRGLYPDSDLTCLEIKVEQVRDYCDALSEGVISDKQRRRLVAKVTHLLQRIKDVYSYVDILETSKSSLEEWRAFCEAVLEEKRLDRPTGPVTRSMSRSEEISRSGVADYNVGPAVQMLSSGNLGSDGHMGGDTHVIVSPMPSFVPPVRNIAASERGDTAYRSLVYGKLPHPLSDLIAEVNNLSLSTPDAALNFLVFLDNLQSQCRILGTDPQIVLPLIFSKLSQSAVSVLGGAVESNTSLGALQALILNRLFPFSVRISFLKSHYCRAQRTAEPLLDFVREIKMYARVLGVADSEEQIVNTIMDGVSPQVASCMYCRAPPRTFQELDDLCYSVLSRLQVRGGDGMGNVRVEREIGGAAVHPCSSQQEPPLARASGRRCYRCHREGHFIRDCPVRALRRDRGFSPSGSRNELPRSGGTVP